MLVHAGRAVESRESVNTVILNSTDTKTPGCALIGSVEGVLVVEQDSC